MEGYRNEKKKVYLDRDRARDLYYKGFTSAEIAEKLDVVKETVRLWMKDEDLEDNKPKPKKGERTPLEQDVHDAIRLGMTYGQFKCTYPNGLPEKLKEKPKAKKKKKE